MRFISRLWQSGSLGHFLVSRRSGALFFSLLLISGLFLVNVNAVFSQSGLAAPQTVSISGVFTTVWEDLPPNSTGSTSTYYSVTDDNGTTYYVSLDPTVLAQVPNGVAGLNLRRVNLSGTVAAPGLGASNSLITVQSIQIDNKPGAPGPPKLTGSKPFVSVLCRFKDFAAFTPNPLSYFVDQLNDTYPGFNTFIRRMSYNQANIDGSTATGWYTLPKNQSEYFASPNYLNALATDCAGEAVAAGFDFRPFYGINLMLNDKVNPTGSALGGFKFLSLNGTARAWAMTWMPYSPNGPVRPNPYDFGWLGHGILAHEMSHAFGSAHSGSSIGYEYGSSWDTVSNPQAHCADTAGVVDANYGCVGQGVIPTGRKLTFDRSTVSQTITLDDLSDPTTTNSNLMIVIPSLATPSSRFYTVEARIKKAGNFDGKLPGNGVLIHDVDTTRGGGNPNAPIAYVVPPPGAAQDALRYSGSGQRGTGDLAARWTVGTTLLDATNRVSINVTSATANGFVITVSTFTAPPLIVTIPNDSGAASAGTTGTLSYALTNAIAGQAINFNLSPPGRIVSVNGQLPSPTNVGVLLDGGNCNAGPSITIQATEAATGPGVNGLVINKKTIIKNIRIVGFGGKELVSKNGGDAVLTCVKALQSLAPAALPGANN